MRQLAVAAAIVMLIAGAPARAQPPHLASRGGAVQLVVKDEPFLILGAELGNSTASDLGYLDPFWKSFHALHVNTVLAPVYWELLEPAEGKFDFALVDGLVDRARRENMKLVLLWFATWKNSMSTYAPPWVKRDGARFVRARTSDGKPLDILSPHDAAARDADARAFGALMAHLQDIDSDEQTVVMVQVENEVGMLTEARDHSAPAEADWAKPVPEALLARLRRGEAGDVMTGLWKDAGAKDAGSWAEIFGSGPEAEEVFTAWHLAAYVEHVAAAGKAAYPLPLYVNAALDRPGVKPGDRPSGGPLPFLFAAWKAAAPSVDILTPDIYFEDFVGRAAAYHRPGNAVFVPEANGGHPAAAANAAFAIGALGAIGYSPFSIEGAADPESHPLGGAYETLASMSDLVLAHQGTDSMVGVKAPVSFTGEVDADPQTFGLGGYDVTVTFVDPWTPRERQNLAAHGGLIIATGPGEYVAAGKGLTLTFASHDEGAEVGIESAEEGRYVDGRWRPGRRLNGDQTHQGRHIRLPPDAFSVQRFTLYSYR